MFRALISILIILFFFGFWFITNSSETIMTPSEKTTSPSLPKPMAKKVLKGDLEVYAFMPHFLLREEPEMPENLTDFLYFGLQLAPDGTIKRFLEDGSPEGGFDAWHHGEILSGMIEEADSRGINIGLTFVAQDNDEITELLTCPTCWVDTVDAAVREMDVHNAQALVLDIEYSGIAPQELRLQMNEFVKYVVAEVHSQAPNSKVLVSTYANAAYRQRLHDVHTLSGLADSLIIMAYDFYPLEGETAGPIAPVTGAPEKFRYDLTMMLNDYLKVAPAEKLIMGIPFYAHSWVTETEDFASPRVIGSDLVGYSKVLFVNSCSQHSQNTEESRKFDPESQSPWFSYRDPETGSFRQCYYEDEKSITAKANLARKNGLKGVSVWAMGLEGNDTSLWDALR